MSYIDDEKTALLVLAYPNLYENDKNWIDSFRKEHDHIFYGIVEPHFTIVFPTFGIKTEDFIEEIHNKSKNIHKFNFTIRCALINNDRLSEYHHIFLSPDEGNSNIVKIHDLLYSGIIRKTLRLDIDFFSHIGIGCYKDLEKCKSIVDMINEQNINIKGSITSLDIISFGERKVRQIEKIFLI
jgi:hypothetical protein